MVIISADHGHKDIEKVYNVKDMEEIQDCLIMPPSLESRAVTFWVKDDKKDKFENYFKDNLKDEFLLYTKEELLEKNLLGYGNKHPKIDDFIGNYIAISFGSSYLINSAFPLLSGYAYNFYISMRTIKSGTEYKFPCHFMPGTKQS